MVEQVLRTAMPDQDKAQMSVAEIRALTPRQVHRVCSAPIRPMSEKQRAHNLSPENVARLRANIDSAKARSGGKLPSRRGVPDGWAGKARRARLKQVREQADRAADKALAVLAQAGVVEGASLTADLYNLDGTINLAVAANIALRKAISIVRAVDPATGMGAYTASDRVAAARIVLDYTASKTFHGQYNAADAYAKAMRFLDSLVEAAE